MKAVVSWGVVMEGGGLGREGQEGRESEIVQAGRKRAEGVFFLWNSRGGAIYIHNIDQ